MLNKVLLNKTFFNRALLDKVLFSKTFFNKVFKGVILSIFLMICLVLPITGFTASSTGLKNIPKVISFADNDQVSVILSNVDVNRISIKGDKIQHVNGPTGLYTAKTDGIGAVFLTVYTRSPFTVYLSTVKGHSVSLFIAPRSMVGKTIVLRPTTIITQTAHWEKNSAYQGLLITLMNGMVNHQAPEGYAYKDIKKIKEIKEIQEIKKTKNIKKAQSVDFFGIANITPIAMFTGAHLIGVVSIIHNKTRKPITLKPSYFYSHGVRSVALSCQTIRPLGTGLLYKIVGR